MRIARYGRLIHPSVILERGKYDDVQPPFDGVIKISRAALGTQCLLSTSSISSTKITVRDLSTTSKEHNTSYHSRVHGSLTMSQSCRVSFV